MPHGCVLNDVHDQISGTHPRAFNAPALLTPNGHFTKTAEPSRVIRPKNAATEQSMTQASTGVGWCWYTCSIFFHLE